MPNIKTSYGYIFCDYFKFKKSQTFFKWANRLAISRKNIFCLRIGPAWFHTADLMSSNQNSLIFFLLPKSDGPASWHCSVRNRKLERSISDERTSRKKSSFFWMLDRLKSGTLAPTKWNFQKKNHLFSRNQKLGAKEPEFGRCFSDVKEL